MDFIDYSMWVMFLLGLSLIASRTSLFELGSMVSWVLAASYSGSLVSVGVLTALLGYVVGTFDGIIVGYAMSLSG